VHAKVHAHTAIATKVALEEGQVEWDGDEDPAIGSEEQPNGFFDWTDEGGRVPRSRSEEGADGTHLSEKDQEVEILIQEFGSSLDRDYKPLEDEEEKIETGGKAPPLLLPPKRPGKPAGRPPREKQKASPQAEGGTGNAVVSGSSTVARSRRIEARVRRRLQAALPPQPSGEGGKRRKGALVPINAR